jgi:hypothetical protein
MRRAAIRWSIALLAAGYLSAAHAQGMSDPTRPPPGWLPPDPTKPEAAAKAEGSGGEPVQLLLVGPKRRIAIVRGEIVGDQAKGPKVEVKRNDIVVSTDRGRETLNLFPDVEKTPPKKQSGIGNKDKK